MHIDSTFITVFIPRIWFQVAGKVKILVYPSKIHGRDHEDDQDEKYDGQILFFKPWHHHKIRSHSAKPIIPTLQYSTIPLGKVTAKPIFSDLAQRTRFSISE